MAAEPAPRPPGPRAHADLERAQPPRPGEGRLRLRRPRRRRSPLPEALKTAAGAPSRPAGCSPAGRPPQPSHQPRTNPASRPTGVMITLLGAIAPPIGGTATPNDPRRDGSDTWLARGGIPGAA